MREPLRLATIALLAALVTAPAAAQDPLGRRVSLDLKAMAPADAFKVLADAIGVSVTVEPGVTKPVDILVRDVRARTALDTICDSIDCHWTLSGRALTVKSTLDKVPAATMARIKAIRQLQAALKQPLPAGLRFENTPLTQVAERLSQITGVTVTFAGGEATTLKVTADVGQLALASALLKIGEQVDGRITCRIRVPAPGDDVSIAALIGGKSGARKIGK
jgi:hypothetical protein